MTVLNNGKLASGTGALIHIWDTETGALTETLTGHNGDVYALALLKNGNLASGSEDNSIKIWNTETG